MTCLIAWHRKRANATILSLSHTISRRISNSIKRPIALLSVIGIPEDPPMDQE